MKRKVLGLILVFLSFLTMSCGGDTKDWPRLCSDLKSEDVIRIEAEMCVIEDNGSKTYSQKLCTKADMIDYNVNQIIGIPYEKKVKVYKPYNNWYVYVHLFIYKSNEDVIEINYYCYGLCDGLISFKENEYHYIPGHYRGAYEHLVEDGRE